MDRCEAHRTSNERRECGRGGNRRDAEAVDCANGEELNRHVVDPSYEGQELARVYGIHQDCVKEA